MDEVPVVTAFLRHDAEVLACHRSETAPTYPGCWGGVSGSIEDTESAIEAGRREAREETGLEALTLVRTGSPLSIEAPAYDRTFLVHPVLFDAPERSVSLSTELQATEWLPPTRLRDRETVPRLFETYHRVAPTVQSVAGDDEHGAATISIRALEVLRDRAGLLLEEAEPVDAEAGGADTDDENDSSRAEGAGAEPGADGAAELRSLADRLRNTRPSMPVLRNRLTRALAAAAEATDGDHPTPAAVEQAAIDEIQRALAADAEAALRAAALVEGKHVLTLSRSGTVLAALRSGRPAAISVAESRPAREGIGVAETLADETDARVTVHTDAAIAHRLATEPIDAVLVGADAVLPDARIVNKTGTRGLALAAADAAVPVYVAAAADKVTTRSTVNLEAGDAAAVYDGDAAIDVANPTFDVTPADAVLGVVTERGVLDTDGVAEVAEELRALERDEPCG